VKELVRERTFTWSDPRALARELAAGSGVNFLARMERGELPPPPVIEALGMQPEHFEDGRVAFSMQMEEWMCNPAAVVHGGMAATLLDTVLTLAVLSKLPHGKTCQTVQLNVNYVRPLLPTGEKIVGEATAVHVGSTIGTAEGRVLNAAGKLVAHGTATLAVLDLAAMATKYPAAP
jgi:uncharacterized protein (TIGR00369 family)